MTSPASSAHAEKQWQAIIVCLRLSMHKVLAAQLSKKAVPKTQQFSRSSYSQAGARLAFQCCAHCFLLPQSQGYAVNPRQHIVVIDHMHTFCKAVVAGPLQFTPAAPTSAPWVPEPLLHPPGTPSLPCPITPCLSCVIHAAPCKLNNTYSAKCSCIGNNIVWAGTCSG